MNKYTIKIHRIRSRSYYTLVYRDIFAFTVNGHHPSSSDHRSRITLIVELYSLNTIVETKCFDKYYVNLIQMTFNHAIRQNVSTKYILLNVK